MTDIRTWLNSLNVESEHIITTREERANSLVHGWIRQYCKSVILIPIEIIELCVLFYLIKMVFYKEKHGHGLEFDDDENMVTLVNAKPTEKEMEQYVQQQRYRTCLFGVTISADECDLFYITFKWMKGLKERFTKQIMMGYITNTIESSIENYNQYSYGIFTGNNHNGFYLYKNYKNWKFGHKKLVEKNFKQPNEGDEFKLLFDFKNDKLYIHQNRTPTINISLEGVRQIMPAFSLSYEGQRIKVIDWEFRKGNKTWS